MKNTDDILQIVTGNLKSSRKNEVLSGLHKDEEAREEFRKIKNIWALASSTKEMPEKQVEILYLNFKKQLALKQKPFRLFSLPFLLYAAMLLILLSIGSVGVWSFYQKQKTYIYSAVADLGNNSKMQLHLSNGTIVELEKENSKIALSSDQKITINNERIIDLNKTNQADESTMNEVVVPFGKKSQLTLEDGTKIWLNAGSRIAFPTKFKGDRREVFLEGEGYFEVAVNQKLPFYVNTSKISIKVLGTKFNISAYENDKRVETVLIEGSVTISERSAVSFMNKSSILKPNQKASYERNDRTLIVIDEPNVDNVISWTEGWLKFDRQSINEVLNKLQRYYNVQFELNKEFPTEDLITGKLYLKDSIEQVMMTMEVVARLKYQINGNKISIERKN